MVKRLIQKLGRKVRGRQEPSTGKKPSTEKKPSTGQEPSTGKAPAAGERPSTGPPRRKRRSRPSRGGGSKGDAPSHRPWSLDSFQVPPKEGEARFHDFGLPDEIMHAVHDLDFKYCTPIQKRVLAHARKGDDIAGRAQTGTGKTAAFLICIIAQFLANPGRGRKPGTPRTLVIAPTRELVIQIVKDAHDLAKHCAFRSVAVYGGMDFNKQIKQLDRPVDLVAATPGRLLDFVRRGVLDLKHIEVLVIDEADRMLDMGFIPDVRRIIRATPPKHERQTMLFSATLTDDVLRLASQWMTDPEFCEVDPEQVAVDTVELITYIVSTRGKFDLLRKLLDDKAMERVLIFGNRRDSTYRLATKLRQSGISCEYLSGAVRQEKRLKVLEDFRGGKIRVVVATDVAGRGLHVDNITHVVNYEFPHEPEDYVHRIGRTGRAGIKGTAISFACEEESFVIPEIEEYIGQPLRCTMPPE